MGGGTKGRREPEPDRTPAEGAATEARALPRASTRPAFDAVLCARDAPVPRDGGREPDAEQDDGRRLGDRAHVDPSDPELRSVQIGSAEDGRERRRGLAIQA